MAKKTWKKLCREKRRFWKTHIRAWERSGLTQSDYCRRNRLKATQFTYWKIKFTQDIPESVSFVPVPVKIDHMQSELDSGDSGLSVQLGKIKIRIHNNFNPASLVKVVSLLEERS